MTKPYQTATPEQRPAHNVPETYTVKRMKTLALWTAGVLVAVVGWILADLTGWAPVALLALIVAAAFGLAGWLMLEYTNRVIERDLPKHPKAKKVGDEWIINLKREIPVSDRGVVEMEPTRVKLPVEPKKFAEIVRQMKRTGATKSKRPPGVGQPKWAKIMSALEEMGGAQKGPNGYEFTPDLDALLSDIERW